MLSINGSDFLGFCTKLPHFAINVPHMIAFLFAALFTLPPQQSDAVIGVTGIHLQSGRRIGVRSDERFPMGSVYKFPIALAALQRVDQGKLSLEQKITIQPKDFAPGWSPLRDNAKEKPITITLREMLRSMVEISDNTACDNTLRLLGGPSVVAARLKELGLPGIHVNRSETEMSRDLHAKDGVEQYARDPRDTATPDDMAALLTAVWQRRDGLSKNSHDLLMKWMTDTTTGARRIKSILPEGAAIAHKTGTMPGTVNDAAIITSPDGRETIVLVIFTKQGTSPEKTREDDVAAVAKKAYGDLMK